MGTYWTIQTIDAWENAKQLGFLSGDPNKIWPEFSDAYNWMMQQMKKKIPKYTGEYPIWLWTEKPDLRRYGHLNKGERGVLLKVEIEDSRLLLSDFMAWHSVIYNTYFFIDEDEDHLFYTSNRTAIEESWQRIFDLEFLEQNSNWGDVRIQGVTGKLTLDEISIVREFIAR
ncbi:hypothetical protein QE429_003355 [Bacillus sp. SORGH_AS 510]|uniref:DUF3841 domain-containing protein n=1 Tax=Bacillus sp. SORGH_AS_0510 TaxID=3041771 RepID=UPI0027809D17|nr:DUF3841 domain-containing protein [Bacillus sp. SORGH_AS_0510]MDQ1146528.1 hypothetical protein [Bacillus sp. SORGH_AS_0510]